MKKEDKYIYFSENDFKNCTPACSIDDMDENLIILLDRMRKIINQPIIINSAYRSVEYEKKKGRNGISSHCTGKAVDIHCGSDSYKFLIVQTALSLGFGRIGIGSNFVHLDLDNDKTQKVMWTY